MRLKKWHKVGLGWGSSMFVMMTFILPYFNGEEITLQKVLIGVVFWIILGSFFFGFSMRKRLEKRN